MVIIKIHVLWFYPHLLLSRSIHVLFIIYVYERPWTIRVSCTSNNNVWNFCLNNLDQRRIYTNYSSIYMPLLRQNNCISKLSQQLLNEIQEKLLNCNTHQELNYKRINARVIPWLYAVVFFSFLKTARWGHGEVVFLFEINHIPCLKKITKVFWTSIQDVPKEFLVKIFT